MFRSFFDEAGIRVGIWACGHREAGWCEAERLGRAEVVVPLAGSWVQEGTTGEHVATPTTAMLGSAGDEYRVRHPAGGGDRSLVFLLRDDALADLSRTAGGIRTRDSRFAAASVPVPPDLFLELHRLLARLDDTEIPEPVETMTGVAGALNALLTPLTGPGGAPPDEHTGSRHQRQAVQRTLEFLAASFRQPISLSDVARVAGYSPFHFARLFRAATGSTIHSRLNELRLRDALYRIREGDSDIGRIALRAGFSSHSHFTAAFRRRFGATPSAIRRRS